MATGNNINKKLLFLVIAIVLIIAAVVVIIVACSKNKGGKEPDEVEVPRTTYMYGEFEYEILENDTLKIVGYTESDNAVEDLVVPTSIEGRLVTEIGDDVFAEATAKTVLIGMFVEKIGDGAFYRCGAGGLRPAGMRRRIYAHRRRQCGGQLSGGVLSGKAGRGGAFLCDLHPCS